VGLPGERRVATTPESVRRLVERGFAMRVERGAGTLADVDDEAYSTAGAELVDDPWVDADAVLKVRAPTLDEAARLREGAVLVAVPRRRPGNSCQRSRERVLRVMGLSSTRAIWCPSFPARVAVVPGGHLLWLRASDRKTAEHALPSERELARADLA
jgi:hypothetical protein